MRDLWDDIVLTFSCLGAIAIFALGTYSLITGAP